MRRGKAGDLERLRKLASKNGDTRVLRLLAKRNVDAGYTAHVLHVVDGNRGI